MKPGEQYLLRELKRNDGDEDRIQAYPPESPRKLDGDESHVGPNASLSAFEVRDLPSCSGRDRGDLAQRPLLPAEDGVHLSIVG